MTDVKILEITHIKDIPDELLGKAIELGEIRKGKEITLLVELVDNPYGRMLIDLFLMEEGQENLIRINGIIPIEEMRDLFVLSENWNAYIKDGEPTVNCSSNRQYHLYPD